MNFIENFATVDLILSSKFESRGVDAFALSLIKAEKQIRRIFTYLIFQSPSYTIVHYNDLRGTLAKNNKMYFESFIVGVNLILPKTLKEIYGSDYDKDISDIILFSKDRNKIFHGQITERGLSRSDLLNRVEHIKKWCKSIGEKLKVEIEYDGFSDSFVKAKKPLRLNYMDKFETLDKYQIFLKEELQRK